MKKLNRRLRSFSKSRFIAKTVFFVSASITVFTLFHLEFPKTGLKAACFNFFSYAKTMFLQPQFTDFFSFPDLIKALFISLSLAFLATVIGIFFAFFLSLAAAENLSNKLISNSIRFVLSFVRSVPTIIWVLIFSDIVNLGAEAAVLGMSFHSTAYLVKGFSESFEQLDKKTIEALKACGAGYAQVIFQAVIPASLNQLISWSFFRFEINFGNAIAVGAAAGAGGIGYQLFIAGNLTFNINEVGLISYLIFAAALILEIISTRIRNKMRSS